MNTIFCLLISVHTILESLPISSSSHMQLLNRVMAHLRKKAQLSMSTNAEHLMHLPTLFVIGLFLLHEGVWPSILGSASTFFHWLLIIFIANGLTYAFYLYRRKTEKSLWPLPVGFLITAIALLSLYLLPYGSRATVMPIDAFIIGCAQAFSLLPGVSRLALTFVVGCWLGLAPYVSIIFSLVIEFFLVGSAVLQALYKSAPSAKTYELRMRCLLLITVATVIAYCLLDWVVGMAITKTIVYFGWYLLLLSFFCALAMLSA